MDEQGVLMAAAIFLILEALLEMEFYFKLLGLFLCMDRAIYSNEEDMTSD